ncbi:21152_t:CDS:1 [Dentiscutata erythropus]|uniref:21152_t:CDS:1 n=1 Tax=Dentiscutata erythropus TaxID=1348616 RepID=A0A9N9I2U5_9GLOM|nr:21152_t:CDS:1 [Dentiscutata erythropus]
MSLFQAFVSRYDLLKLEPTYHAFDFAFKSIDNNTLISTFSINSTLPKGTVGPKGVKIESLQLCSGSIWKQGLINDYIQYLGWGVNVEEKDARIYVYDTRTSEPYYNAYFVTNGKFVTPVGRDECKSTNGLWSAPLLPKNKNKISTAGFIGKNKVEDKGTGIPYIAGKLKSISIKSELLLASLEESRFDKSEIGVKYLLMEGGEEYLKHKKSCVIC